MKLVEFSINRPVTTYMMIATILLLGAIAFFRLPVDLMPEMEFPTLTVATTYQGVAPEEMETLITRPIEEAVGALAGVEKIRSSSSEGQSSVRISFTWGTDLNEAASDVRTRLDRLRRILPEDADPPTLFKFDTTQFPIMFLAVASSEMDALALRHLMEEQLQYRLERVPGVAAAEIRGGLRREIHVDMFLEKLRALNISPEEVTNTLRRENLNLPVGPVEEGKYELLLRTQGEFQSVDQIRNVVVTARNGIPIYIRDVARVEDSHEEIRQIVRVDDQPGLRLSVRKQAGANTVQVAKAVHEELEKIRRRLFSSHHRRDDGFRDLYSAIHRQPPRFSHLRLRVGGSGPLPVSAQHQQHSDHRHHDPHFHHRHLRLDVLLRVYAEYLFVWRSGSRRGHAARQRHCRSWTTSSDFGTKACPSSRPQFGALLRSEPRLWLPHSPPSRCLCRWFF